MAAANVEELIDSFSRLLVSKNKLTYQKKLLNYILTNKQTKNSFWIISIRFLNNNSGDANRRFGRYFIDNKWMSLTGTETGTAWICPGSKEMLCLFNDFFDVLQEDEILTVHLFKAKHVDSLYVSTPKDHHAASTVNKRIQLKNAREFETYDLVQDGDIDF